MCRITRPPLLSIFIFHLKSAIYLVQIMKQKIVIKVKFKCKKCRSKAMSIAAMAAGVVSVKLQGDEKDQVVVVGDGVDAARMAILLRKKVGHATLELVQELKD